MKSNNPNKKEESTMPSRESIPVELEVTVILNQLGIERSDWSQKILHLNNRTQNKTKP
ncbi:hypothetical protein K0T92_18500 [Paenibacillus oenotherae]|uniref:Uncharacterized protein n=1 Tax=Paenibacillus oenotherae TaxID=1435645 RepID=A0ABS7DB31_9BACL|nr:hypothetical protein [Paenibacillus oenotherae]MBW7476712.1 hypothetical protein [Paenibacillus oenotherae]